jgi:hypothetical protein
MFATIQWLQTWPSFFYGRYAAACPITAPFFFESKTTGLMFVRHRWPQGIFGSIFLGFRVKMQPQTTSAA